MTAEGFVGRKVLTGLESSQGSQTGRRPISARQLLIGIGRMHSILAEKDGLLYDLLQFPGRPPVNPWAEDKKN